MVCRVYGMVVLLFLCTLNWPIRLITTRTDRMVVRRRRLRWRRVRGRRFIVLTGRLAGMRIPIGAEAVLRRRSIIRMGQWGALRGHFRVAIQLTRPITTRMDPLAEVLEQRPLAIRQRHSIMVRPVHQSDLHGRQHSENKQRLHITISMVDLSGRQRNSSCTDKICVSIWALAKRGFGVDP